MTATSCIKMKLRLPSRWQRSKKRSTPSSTPTSPVFNKPQRSPYINHKDARQAVENVRSLSAATGEEFGLTILDRDEELVGWMNFSHTRLSFPATGERRNALSDGFTGWRGVDATVLEAVAGSPPPRSSPASDAPIDTNASDTKRFGKSGIEISNHGRMQVAVPRVQVRFKEVEWNLPSTFRLGGRYGIGPAGEVANFEM